MHDIVLLTLGAHA